MKAIAGWNDEPDHRLRAAQVFELRHHPWQHGLGRRGADRDEQLLPDVLQELQDTEARHVTHDSEHNEYEEKTRRVDAEHQPRESRERFNSERADRECHRAERSDRRDAHHHVDHAEERMRELIDHRDEVSPLFTKVQESDAEQDGEEQHLQNVAGGERAYNRVWNDVQKEIDGAELLGGGGEVADSARIEGRGVGVDADAGLKDVDDNEPDDQRQRRNDFEINDGLDADPADGLQVANLRDAGHDDAEDDRGDHHSDELDEAVAERPHRRPRLWSDVAKDDADHNREQDLDVQDFIKGLPRGYCHMVPLPPTGTRHSTFKVWALGSGLSALGYMRFQNPTSAPKA